MEQRAGLAILLDKVKESSVVGMSPKFLMNIVEQNFFLKVIFPVYMFQVHRMEFCPSIIVVKNIFAPITFMPFSLISYFKHHPKVVK